MTPTQRLRCSRFALAIIVLIARASALHAQSLPDRLSNEEFWTLSSEASESDGYFRSDNLLSNEAFFQYVLPELTTTAKEGRVYLGVGPEQNFTYITALRPKMAFIIDVRRGNLNLQLMYKALFELSDDRADFVSRLFCRPRPEGLAADATASVIFDAIANVESNDAFYTETLAEIMKHLTEARGFPLSEGDRGGIEYVYGMFCRFGPNINYNSSAGGFGGITNRTSYSQLMTATDQTGASRSYLANDDNFNFMKDLQTKNLIVPVVGNFAGTKATRAVAKYLTDANATVSAFYLSNVEQYLVQDGIWLNFCANAATLPLDASSTFIRSSRAGRFGGGLGLNSDLTNMQKALQACAQ